MNVRAKEETTKLQAIVDTSEENGCNHSKHSSEYSKLPWNSPGELKGERYTEIA